MKRREFLKIAVALLALPSLPKPKPPTIDKLDWSTTTNFSAADFIAAVEDMTMSGPQPDMVVMHPIVAERLGLV